MTRPSVSIAYCVGCRWITRASWLAQELLITFGEQLAQVALVPSEPGTFDVFIEEVCIFSRKQEGRFPEPKELKQQIRDFIDPQMDLGHSDRKKS